MLKLKEIILLVIFAGISQMAAANMPGLRPDHSKIFKADDKPRVYYFHASRRCVSCKAVETVARKAVREKYGDEIEFIILNREDEKNKALVEKYKISGQTLLVVKGESVKNLTNMAFMNARKKPDKVKEEIVSAIESLNK